MNINIEATVNQYYYPMFDKTNDGEEFMNKVLALL